MLKSTKQFVCFSSFHLLSTFFPDPFSEWNRNNISVQCNQNGLLKIIFSFYEEKVQTKQRTMKLTSRINRVNHWCFYLRLLSIEEKCRCNFLLKQIQQSIKKKRFMEYFALYLSAFLILNDDWHLCWTEHDVSVISQTDSSVFSVSALLSRFSE